MKLRHYLLLRGYLTAGVVVFLVGLLLSGAAADAFGLYFGIGICAWLAFDSYRCLKNARRARFEDRAYAPPTDASISQQLLFYRRIAMVGVVAFAVLSITTVMDLNRLESGAQKSVSLIVPLGFFYREAGYWAAVLATPLFGALVCGALFWKVIKLGGQSKMESAKSFSQLNRRR